MRVLGNHPGAEGVGAGPFFDAGPAHASAGLPLGLIAGGLILDSGEAERTFLFRCQDRYLGFNTLQGLRTVLLAANDEHVRYYQHQLAGFRRHWQTLCGAGGVLPLEGPAEPLFIACDIDRVGLGACWSLLDQLRRGVLARGESPRLVLNQVSPTTARLVGRLDALLRGHGIATRFDVPLLERLGALALRFHDKARYVELVRRHAGEDLPAHVPTAVIAPERFLEVRGWDELVALYREATGDSAPPALFVKSSLDSGGNVAARLTEATFETRAAWLRREVRQHVLCLDLDFDERARELRGEVDAAPTLEPLALTDDRLVRYKRWQAEQRTGIRLLVQREVAPPEDTGGRFPGMGLSFRVGGPDEGVPLAISAQLYRDAEQRHFMGAWLSPAVARDVLRPPFEARLRRLCRLFAEEGWRGPLSFDARLDRSGEYVLIYDCNPRLTAVYPALALQEGLRRQGLAADEVLTLGYRGEFVWRDLPARLEALAAQGLPYTRERQRGAVILPNLSRQDGFDVALVNVAPAEDRRMLATGAFNEEGGAQAAPQVHG